MPKSIKKYLYTSTVVLIILTLLVGCNLPSSNTISLTPAATKAPEYQQTLVEFKVNLAEPLPAGDSIYLTLLDEVTGLAF